MTKLSDLEPTRDGRVDPDLELVDEADHFYICKSCGQAVDMRDLGQVLYHEEPRHRPLEMDA